MTFRYLPAFEQGGPSSPLKMNDLKKAFRTTMIIGFWMIGCVFVCAIIVELVKTSGHSLGATSPVAGSS